MRKIFFVIAILISTAVVSNAAPKKPVGSSVSVSDITLLRVDGQVAVTFKFQVADKTVKRSYSLVVTPVLQNGSDRQELTPVVVQGRKARLLQERYTLASVPISNGLPPFYTAGGKTVNYGVTVPYQQWMTGSQLVFEGVSVGCCTSTEVEIGLIAENLLHYEPETVIEIVEVQLEPEPSPSTGGLLAEMFPFVRPVSDMEKQNDATGELFDYSMPLNLGKGLTTGKQQEIERFIDGTREGSVSIIFTQGSRTVDRNLGDNNKVLVELISIVRMLEASEDSDIARIVIAGFASPEGTLTTNDRVAWERAVALKDFLVMNSEVQVDLINIYNGSVDWQGLRELVAKSDMYEKYRIMDIIDNTPIWDARKNVGRHGELMRLSGGEPYRYMLRNFFPQLRQAAYIKVYYKNK